MRSWSACAPKACSTARAARHRQSRSQGARGRARAGDGARQQACPRAVRHRRRGVAEEEARAHRRARDRSHPVCSRNTGSRAAGSAYIAVLDATLGLFQKLPAKASGILDRLKGTSPGAGRRAFPELAAWLADDALLDRFTHLCQLASVPTALTKQLKEDFGHADKAARERAHLVALPVRHARQEARLSTLLATERTLATAPRGRTKRRFAERIDELLPVAYRRELDASFREILRDAWGISVPSMTHGVARRGALLARRRRQPRSAGAPPARGRGTHGRKPEREALLRQEPRVDREGAGADRRRGVARAAARGDRRRGHALRRGARGGSARGPAHGDPVRDVPRARQRLECGVDGAERRRREQARALRPQP